MDLSQEPPHLETTLSIDLTNGAEPFKELYFSDGRGSVFTYRSTKILLRAICIFAILTGVLYLVSLPSDKISYVVLLTFSGLGTLFMLLVFLYYAYKYFKWKKDIDALIKKVASYKKFSLNVNSNGFEAITDDQVVIEKWSNFKQAAINPTHIFLHNAAGENYLFPSKSMQPPQYEALTQLIRNALASNLS